MEELPYEYYTAWIGIQSIWLSHWKSLCRTWKSRVKGRDWYDLVWYAANHPELNLVHLEHRMRQTGHWTAPDVLRSEKFQELLQARIDELDISRARDDVLPFVRDPRQVAIWSREFLLDVASRIKVVGL